MPTYPDTRLLIDGHWTDAADGARDDVVNPATGAVIGTVAHAGPQDFDRAVAAAERGFAVWSATSAFERSAILRRAASLLRERMDEIAPVLTLEQGKPLSESRAEIGVCADVTDWAAEEGRRIYGRTVPSRAPGIIQTVIKSPVGPVAGFAPWNFPMSQVARKMAAALGTGCSIIIKAPEDTPASPALLMQAFLDAGVPAGVLGLLYGNPAEISERLIPDPAIRKITFTGSTAVGKHLAALAGRHMKRATMELGGHAPVIVTANADLDAAIELSATAKFRNAGQVCISPTRFLIERPVYDRFLEGFVAKARAVRVGDGLAADTTMGPLANERRVPAIEALLADATTKGARIETGGERLGNAGNFFAPTVVTGVTPDMTIMNEEPFGPVALLSPFSHFDDAIAEANRLPYGLAAYGFTQSASEAAQMRDRVRSGMLTINHLGLGLPEIPFGGIGDSGYGSEGGIEALEAYLETRLVTHRAY